MEFAKSIFIDWLEQILVLESQSMEMDLEKKKTIANISFHLHFAHICILFSFVAD